MSFIKNIAFDTQQSLLHSTGVKFKRSHIYELIAAAFGYNSYASIPDTTIFIKSDEPFMFDHDAKNNINRRCGEIGYSDARKDIVENSIIEILEQNGLSPIGISELIKQQNLIDREDYFPPEISSEDISRLEEESVKKDADTFYFLANYYRAEIENDGVENKTGAIYWYNQMQSGRILTGVEKEWAKNYRSYISQEANYLKYLRKAASLGNSRALLDMAEKFDDPTFFEQHSQADGISPMRIVSIAESLGRPDDARRYLNFAAEAGDIEAMRELIEEYDKNDLEQCWVWIYLSRLVGHDLTKDRYFEIDENGGDYDDDIGGAVYVDGEGGIEIEDLSEWLDDKAKATAQMLFRKLPINN